MATKGKRLNPFQAARLRPAVVLGDCFLIEKEDWTCVENVEPGEAQIKYCRMKSNQGLKRVFVEAISNAIDNVWTSIEKEIPMKKIEITVDRSKEGRGRISVYNDGAFIPVVKQQFEYEDYRTGVTSVDEVYPAEFYFGEMYAGTNFEGNEKKKTSGRNGMGGKALVVYSDESTVEHTDPEAGKKFVQTFGKAGKTRTDPVITSYRAKTGYTKVSFVPDYEFFNYPGCDDDFVYSLKKLAHDTAMVTGVPVSFVLKEDGPEGVVETLTKMSYKTMKAYVSSLYFPGEKGMMSFVTDQGDECFVVQRSNNFHSTEETTLAQQSWINGILTTRGGTHVDAWSSALMLRLVKAFNATRKEGEGNATAKDFAPYLMLFVKCERLTNDIDFDSQAKERLTKPVKFEICGTKAARDALNEQLDAAVKKMLKWEFVKIVKELLDHKIAAKVEKEDNKTRIKFGEKVKNAKFAGTAKGSECTFWIGEGDSAVRFVERVISKVPGGYDYNGWMPIRGKTQNSEAWSEAELFENAELKSIKDALGLKLGMKPQDISKLRYGRVMIAADADMDGDHIRGLLVCFFHHFWPEICWEGYVWFFSTIVTKITGKGETTFYNEEKAKKYIIQNKIPQNRVFYYKGLAKHTIQDAKHYIDNPHYINLVMDEDSPDLINLAFGKDKKQKSADRRKDWMIEHYFSAEDRSSITEDYKYDGKVPLREFIYGPLLIFSAETTRRSIPAMIDGLKHSQRQALFGMIELNLKQSLSVEELAGRIKTLTKYHHGAVSLENTIAGMAQGFQGSNNIPLFKNDGEFGTRILGGKDRGQSRYLTSSLEEIARKIFRPEDDPILDYEIVEGTTVQPVNYVPVINMTLVNGSSGISTGWKTEIPNYDPERIVEWTETYLEMIDGHPEFEDELPSVKALQPWYRGYNGEITIDSEYPPKFWVSKGILSEEIRKTAKGNVSKLTEWHITELPIGLWTETAKAKLIDMWDIPKTSKKVAILSEEPQDNRTDVNDVHFVIRPTKEFTPDLDTPSNPIAKLLTKKLVLSQMNFLNAEGVPTKFDAVEDILLEHAKVRLFTYQKRKDYWMKHYRDALVRSRAKYVYVKAVVEGDLDMHQEDANLEQAMSDLGLEKLEDGEKAPSYNYLLSMQMRSMSVKKLAELKKEADDLILKIDNLKKETPISMWRKDLSEFREAYKKFLRTRKEQ
jgi:DNA topoisomerase II